MIHCDARPCGLDGLSKSDSNDTFRNMLWIFSILLAFVKPHTPVGVVVEIDCVGLSVTGSLEGAGVDMASDGKGVEATGNGVGRGDGSSVELIGGRD